MKPEHQRIKIAEACGFLGNNELDCWKKNNRYYFNCGDSRLAQLPDYLNDLNAMAGAEKSIWDGNLYRKFLYLAVLDDPENIANEPAWATAAQRAEAFLRTLGLWEEKS